MPRQLKIAVIFLTAAIGVLLLAVAAYVLYVYLQYYRIDDGQILTVSSEKTDTIRTGKTYSVKRLYRCAGIKRASAEEKCMTERFDR